MESDDESEGLFSSLFGKLFKRDDDSVLEHFITMARRDGDLTAGEQSLLLNVLRLGRKQVREIMIPRTDIACAPLDDAAKAVTDLIIERGHSRIPIYRGNRDNIVGIVHAKDFLRSSLQPGDGPVDVRKIMRKPLFIPDTKIVRDMLQEFQSAKKSIMAIALDEYGGTSGPGHVRGRAGGNRGRDRGRIRRAQARRTSRCWTIKATYSFPGRTPLFEELEKYLGPGT